MSINYIQIHTRSFDDRNKPKVIIVTVTLMVDCFGVTFNTITTTIIIRLNKCRQRIDIETNDTITLRT